MRTSYSRDHAKVEKEVKKKEVKKEEISQSDQTQIEDSNSNVENMLMDAYESIENELAYSRQNDLNIGTSIPEEYSNDFDGNTVNTNNGNNKKKKKSNKGLIIGCSVAISVIVLGIGGYAVYNRFFNTGKALLATEESISRLYTTPEKTDIKSGISQNDLNEYYMELIGIQKKGENVDNAVMELDTIGYFLNDKARLEEYNSDSYNLTTVGLTDSVAGILQNTREYSVSGLAVTISNMAKEVTSDYENFISLRQELNGISDVMNFDESAYKGRIDLVTHIPNKTELSAICEKLVVDKKAAIAQKKVQEAADDQARAEAEKALKEAQELQKKTQLELDATKKKLEEEAQKAAEAIENQNNGVTNTQQSTPQDVGMGEDKTEVHEQNTEQQNQESQKKEQEGSPDWSEQEETFNTETDGIAIPIPQTN